MCWRVGARRVTCRWGSDWGWTVRRYSVAWVTGICGQGWLRVVRSGSRLGRRVTRVGCGYRCTAGCWGGWLRRRQCRLGWWGLARWHRRLRWCWVACLWWGWSVRG